ncbi:hypothetical protein EYY60_09270 [Flavobacterium zhairuonense]|uniref:hypothetical protein n=1 Tax=Flavobacterium zhairuonense TaxID=2493631 RepID=UPI001047CD43|nr:hypothetical protein [Flavobacterium zhairuonense]KAF2510692.1 hypothetical protein EYY60_09270 [Flavobacterium zhairuonense]
MKTENTNWNYFLKHCISTLLLAPFISQAFFYIFPNSHQIIGLLEIYPLTLFMSLIFSSPTYILNAYLYQILSKKAISALYSKVILISMSIIGIFITMYLIIGYMWLDFAISYSLSSLITGMFFKLNFEKKEPQS